SLKKQKLPVTSEYTAFLDAIKNDIVQSQLRVMQSVTRELVMLYWRIGKSLSEKSQKEGWGSKVIATLARDIKIAFPDLKGFSPRNLVYMKTFYQAYPDVNYAAVAAQIPWGHIMVILDTVEKTDQRLWYTDSALRNGWSRSVLEMWIESDLYSRQGKSITN